MSFCRRMDISFYPFPFEFLKNIYFPLPSHSLSCGTKQDIVLQKFWPWWSNGRGDNLSFWVTVKLKGCCCVDVHACVLPCFRHTAKTSRIPAEEFWDSQGGERPNMVDKPKLYHTLLITTVQPNPVLPAWESMCTPIIMQDNIHFACYCYIRYIYNYSCQSFQWMHEREQNWGLEVLIVKTIRMHFLNKKQCFHFLFALWVWVWCVCLFRPDRVGDFLRSNQIMKSCQRLYTVVNCSVFLYNPTIRPETESKPSVGESDRLQLEKRIDNTATRVMGLA